MTHNDIDNFKFDDPDLDKMTDYNYYARNALIKREISKQEYLEIENTLMLIKTSIMSGCAKNILKTLISDS